MRPSQQGGNFGDRYRFRREDWLRKTENLKIPYRGYEHPKTCPENLSRLILDEHVSRLFLTSLFFEEIREIERDSISKTNEHFHFLPSKSSVTPILVHKN